MFLLFSLLISTWMEDKFCLPTLKVLDERSLLKREKSGSKVLAFLVRSSWILNPPLNARAATVHSKSLSLSSILSILISSFKSFMRSAVIGSLDLSPLVLDLKASMCFFPSITMLTSGVLMTGGVNPSTMCPCRIPAS